MDNTTGIKNILLVFLVVLCIYLMSALSSLLVPLAMAILFALLFHPLQLMLIRWKIPKFLTIPLIFIISLLIINFIISSVISTGIEISSQNNYITERLLSKFESILEWLESITGGSFKAEAFHKTYDEFFIANKLTEQANLLISNIGTFTGSFIIFLIYYVILLSGMYNYKKFISYLAGNSTNSKFIDKFEQIQKELIYFIKYKTFLNLLAAVIYTIILFAFGIPFALFLGILAFLLYFIPNFGALIATLLAIVMAVIQFDSPTTILVLVLLIFFFNFIIGSIIEPKVMGDKLRLNTITVIFGLLFWGFIWGIPGMFLSVPLLVIMKIIFESFPGLELIGRIMGYPENQIQSPQTK